MATNSKRRGRGEGGVYQRSDGNWCAAVDLGWQDGKRKRKVIYGRTRREVADRLNALLPQASAGFVTAGRAPTVTEAVESWLSAAGQRLKPKTVESYRWVAHRYVVPALGRKRADKVTPADIRAMVTGLSDRGLSARTAQYAHRVASMALGDAVKLGQVAHNPAARVSAPRPRRTAQGALTASEARKLLAAAQTAPHGDLWTLALTSGARQGELLQLRWADVDLGARRMRVVEGKSDRSRRYIPLTEVAVKALGEAGPPGDLVFPSQAGTPLGARNVVRWWHGFCEATLGRRVRFHDLRHTCATLLLEQGVPLKVISELLGHSSLAVTSDLYTEVVDALKADAAARMDGIFAPEAPKRRRKKPAG